MQGVTCHSCDRSFATQSDFQSHASRPLVDNEGSFWFRCSCGTALTTPHEIPNWYSIVESVSPRSALLYKKIKDRYPIPRIPAAVMRLNQVLASPDTANEEIASAVKIDPVLAANVLRLANTYKKPSIGAITSIEHAVAFIGRQTVAELVIMAAIDQFETERCPAFSYSAFWSASLKAGRVGELLAASFAPHIPLDMAYLATSLANVGKILMAIVSPRTTGHILEIQSSRTERANWCKIELELDYETDHRRMGEIAAALWGLPHFVAEICLEHHNLNKIMVNTKAEMDLLDIVSVSVQIHHLLFDGAAQTDEMIVRRFAKRFSLDQTKMKELIGSLHKQLS